DKGKQQINIKVYNQAHVPALYVTGKYVQTDKEWLATFEDKEWIDETGKASDASGTTYVKVGYWNMDNPNEKPSQFRLPTRPEHAVSKSAYDKCFLVDFGKNTFGFLTLHKL